MRNTALMLPARPGVLPRRVGLLAVRPIYQMTRLQLFIDRVLASLLGGVLSGLVLYALFHLVK